MKKIIPLFILLPSLLVGEDLNLICSGTATEKSASVISSNTTNPFDVSQRTKTQTVIPKKSEFDSSIYLNLDLENATGNIEVLKSLRRKGAKITKTNLTDLIVNKNTIEGKAKWNAIARIKFVIDRRTGTIDYSTTGNISFNGNCSKFEPENKF